MCNGWAVISAAHKKQLARTRLIIDRIPILIGLTRIVRLTAINDLVGIPDLLFERWRHIPNVDSPFFVRGRTELKLKGSSVFDERFR